MPLKRFFLLVLVAFALAAKGQIAPGTISISGNQTICPGTVHGTLTVTAASGCSGGCSYQWMSSTDDITYSNITSANGLTYTSTSNTSVDTYYKVSISDGVNTAVETSSFLVSVHELPTVTISATPGLTVPSGATVSLSALLSNAPANYTYSYVWSNSATANPTTVTPTATTNYTVTATDQYSCSATSTAVTVTVDPLVGGVIATTDNTICSGSVPTALTSTSAASGGTGSNYTYQWQKSTTSTTTGFTDITGADQTTYTPVQAITQQTYFRRKVTNAGIAGYSNVITYSIDALPTVTVTASPSTVPSGGTTTLSATGASTYAWTETGSSTLNATTGNSVTANPTVQTTYTATGTDANGCTASDNETVNVAVLNAGTISGAQDVCVNATPTTITSTTAASGGSGISGNYIYSWQSSANADFTSATGLTGETGTTLSFSAAMQAGGTLYYRRGVRDNTDPNNTVAWTTGVLKTARALPTVTASANPSTNIPAGASVTLTASATGSGGYTYTWSNTATGSPTTVTPTATTNYTVTATDQYSCSATSTAVTVTVDPLVGGVIATTDNTICSGSVPTALTSTSAASGGTGSNYTYQWQKSTTSTTTGFTDITGADQTTYTPVQAITQQTYFRRKVTNAGIAGYSNVITYSIDALPTVTVTASPSTVPSGGTTTLSATGASTYAWTETGSSTLNATTGNSVTANPTVQTTYTATGTDANGCTASDNETVNVAVLNAGTISGAQDVCVNATPTTITSTTAASGGSSGSYTYKWQLSTDNQNWTDITNSNNETYSPAPISASTHYRRGVSDPALSGTWVYTTSIYKELKALPTISIARNPSGAIPSGASVQFTASGAGSAGNYNWSFNSTQNPVSQVITGTTTVTISVTGQDVFGCEASAQESITITPINAGAITTSSSAVCENGIPSAITSLSLASGGTGTGYTYTWYKKIGSGTYTLISGATGSTFTPTSPITQTTYFKRRATNAGVFEETLPVTYTISPKPSIQVSATATTISSGTSVTISSTPSTLSGYSWSSGQSTSSITVAPTSTSRYILTVTDGNGCENKDSIDINVVQITPGTISESSDFCEGTAPSVMTLVGTTGGSGLYSYQWMSSADGVSYSNVTGGSGSTTTAYSPGTQNATIYYKVKISDQNNSSNVVYSNPVTRTVLPSPTLTVTVNKNRPIAFGSNITINASGANTYRWEEGSVNLTYQGRSYWYTSSHTYTPSNTNQTTLTVYGQSSAGCITSDTVNIKANVLVEGSISNPNSAICEGSTLPSAFTGTAASGGSGSQTYQWQSSWNNINWSSIGNANTQNYHYQLPLTQSTYFRRLTIDQSYEVASNVFLVTVNPRPTVSISKSPSTTSSGAWPDGINMTLTATSGLSSYLWSPIAGSSASLSVSPTTTTTYNLTVTDANGCENNASTQVPITYLNPGTLNNQSICGNSSVSAITATGDGGGSNSYTFSWESSTDNQNFSTIAGATAASYTPSPAPNQTTYYRRTITDNGISKSSTATVIVAPVPSVTVDKPTATITTGGTVRIRAYGANSYSWNDGSQNVGTNWYIDVSPTISPTTYTVTGTDVNGCQNSTTSVISISSFDPGEIEQDSTICAGESPVISSKADASGGVGVTSYYWRYSNDGTNFFDLGYDNQKSIQPGPLNQDRWYIRRAINNGVVYWSNIVHITVLQGPTTEVTAVRTTIAKGDTTTLSVTGANTYTYSPSSYVITPGSGATVNVKPSATATFTVVGTIANGCSSSDVVEIQVYERLPGAIQSTGATTICPGTTPSPMNFATLPSSGSGSYTLRWQYSTDNISWNYITGANANTFAPTTPTYANIWYRVEILDPGVNVKPYGVKKYTPSLKYSVIAPTQLQITSTYDTIPPNGVGNQLTVAGGTPSTFEWYEGSLSSTVAATGVSTFSPTLTSTATTYYLKYTDGTCVTNASKVIYTDDLEGGVVANSQSICEGATSGTTITSTSVASGGTQGSYLYQWQVSSDQSTWTDVTNANDPTLTPIFTSGLTQDRYYRRKVTNAGVASYSNTSTVTVIPNPTVGVTASSTFNTALDPNDPVIPEGATITLTGSGPTGMTYAWSPSSGLSSASGVSVSASPAQTRNYIITGTTTDGCQDTIHMKVRVNTLTAGEVEIYNGTSASASLSICPGDPAPSGSVIRPKTTGGDPAGGSGTYLYQWQYSLDQVTWTSITSAQNTSFNLATYVLNSTFDNVSTTRYYRRRVTNTGVNKDGNSIQLGVYTRPSVLITSQSDTIPPGGTNVLTASGGGAGTYASYEWHIGSIGASPATGTTYSIALNAQNNQTTYVLRGSDANCSNTFSKTIYVSPLVAGVINGDQTICEGATSGTTLTSTSVASGGTQGSYLYQWQESSDQSTWTDVTNANDPTLTPIFTSGLTQDRYYRRKVTNAGVASYSNTSTVTVIPNPTVGVTASSTFNTALDPNDPVIPEGATITLTGSGPTGMTYAWSPSSGLSSASGVSVSASPAQTRNYIITGTTTDGCQDTIHMKVRVNTLTAGEVEIYNGTSASASLSICPGDPAPSGSVIRPKTTGGDPAGGSGTYLYQWQYSLDQVTWTSITSAQNTSFNLATYVLNSTFDNVSTTRYYRRRVTNTGVNKDGNSIQLGVYTRPSVLITSQSDTIPPGGTNVLTASGGGAGTYASYEWHIGSIGASPATGTTYSIALNAQNNQTTYVLRGSDANCSNTFSKTIYVSPLVAGVINGDQTICEGATSGTEITSTSGATGGTQGSYNYQWQERIGLTGTWTDITGANGATYTPTYGAGITTNHYYRRNVSNVGKTSSSNIVTVSLVQNPSIVIQASGQTGTTVYIPNGASIQLNASSPSGQPISTYTWSPYTSLSASTGTSVTATPSASTTYTVVGTSTSNCQAQGTITVDVSNLNPGSIEASINSTPNEAVCFGDKPSDMQSVSGQVISGGSGTYDYKWQRSRDNITWTDITTSFNPTSVNVTYEPNSNDTLNVARFYRRKVTDMGVSAYSNSINISIKPDPTINVSANKYTVPPGGKVTLTATGGANSNSYTWYKRKLIPTQVGTGSPLDLNIPSNGNYVAYGVGSNGCTDSSWLSIQTLALTPGQIGSDQSLCIGNSIQPINNLQSASGGSGSYVYQWFETTDLALGYTAILGANQESYTPPSVSQTTYYKRRVTDSEISKESNVITINVLPNPVVSASTANRYMPPGGTMNLSASGASTYTWTPTVTSQNTANSLVSIVGSGAGKTTYTVTGTDGNGCEGSDTLDIYVRNIVAGAISSNQTICSGALPNPISGVASTGGSGNFSYQWQSSSDNVTFTDIQGETAVNLSLSTPLSATTYYRRKTIDQSIESNSNVVTITVNPSPVLTVGSNKVNNTICQGESITLNALGASTYDWSTQSGGTLATTSSTVQQPTISTVYSVVGTSSLGCVSNTYTITVSVSPAPVVLVTSDYSQIPPGAQVNLSATGAISYSWTPGTGLSSVSGSPVVATPNSTTRYIATGLNAQGCSDTMSVLIKVLPLSGGTIQASKNVCKGDAVGLLTESTASNGGTGTGFTYEWEKSTDNVNWSLVANVTAKSPTISDKVTQTVYFRRKVTNLGVTAYSNSCAVEPIQRPTVSLTSNKTTVPRGGIVTLSAAGASTYVLNGPNGTIGSTLPYTNNVYTTSTFNVIGTDVNSCSDTGFVTVTISKLLPGAIGPNQANCQGSSFNPVQNLTSPSGGSGQYTLQWEESLDGVNWNTIANATQLFYSPGIRNQTVYFRRRVFDSGVDTLSSYMQITVYSNPQVSAVSSHQQVPPGATVTLNATGGSTYTWTGANTAYLSSTTGAPITGQINTTSTYIVNGTDANGCQDTGKVKVIVVPIVGGTINGTNDVCIGQVPPQIFSTALASGGSGNFTYEWEKSTDGVNWTAIPGANSTNLLPTDPAYSTVFYRRNAVNMGVKQSSNVATITVLNKPTIQATSNLSAIPPGASVSLTGTGLAPGGGYAWSALGTQVGTTSFITVSPSVTTEYILTGTDPNGCQNTDTIEVKVVPINSGLIAGYPTSLCEGELLDSIGNIALASGGSGIFAYSWEISNDNVNYTTIPNQNGKTLIYSGIISTPKYFRRKVVDNGIDAYSTPVLISVNPKPLVQAIPLNGRYLPPGATVNLNATSGLVSYSWTPTNVLSTTTTRTVSGTLNSTTIFKVVGTDGNGCSEEDTIRIFARPLNPGSISANQVVCSGYQPVALVSQTTASGGSEAFTYQWQDSTLNATWVNIPGAISLGYTPTPSTVTKYYRRVVTDNGVSKPTNVVTVTVSANPANPIVSDTILCQGEPPFSALNLVAAANGNTLYWYGTQVGGVGSTVAPTVTAQTVGQSYMYVSQVNNSTGCESGRVRIKVTVSALPNTPIVAATTYRCLGSANNVALSASPNVVGNLLRWYDSDGITLLPGAPIPNTGNPGTKTYFVSEYNPSSGCESLLEEVKVIVYSPVTAITVVQNVSCNGGNNGQLSIAASNGLVPYAYSWKKNGSNISIGTQSYIVGLEADIYRVVVTDNRGCQDSSTAEITEPTQLSLSNTKQDPQCYGDNGSITITAGGGTPPYVYSFNNGVTYQSSNTKSLPFGQYTLRVKDSKDCEVTSATAVTLTQATAIAATITSTPTSCYESQDGQLVVAASGGTPSTSGYSYQWNDPNLQTNATATGLAAGTFQVTIYDAVGCSRSFSKSVTSPDSLKVTSIAKQNLTCYNDSTGSLTITAVGGNVKSYSIDNGSTTAASGNFTGLDAGIYSVVVSDTKACPVYYSVSQSQTLTQPNEIILQDVTVDSTTCFDYADGGISLSASGGTNVKYSINGGVTYSTNGIFGNLSSGTYTLDVTDNNNCPANFNSYSSAVIVGKPNKLIVSNTLKSNPTCFDSTNGEITIVASGGRTRQYNLDGGTTYQTDPLFSELSAGTYYVTVRDINLCPVTYNVNRNLALVKPDSVLVEDITAVEPLCHGSLNGSIEITATGGNSLSYSINNGSTYSQQTLFNGLGAGEYRIDVQDSKGCEVTYNTNKVFELTEPDSVIVSNITIENSSCYDSDDGSIEITAGGGNELEYSINNGVTWSSTYTFTNLSPGVYTIRVRDINNCQVFYQTNRSIVLTEPDQLYVSSYVVNPVSCKDGADGSIEVLATGGNTRKYSINGGASYQLDSNFTGLTAGSYSIAVSDNKGCNPVYAYVPSVYVNEPDSVRVESITTRNLDCKNSQDGKIEIDATGGNILSYRIDPSQGFGITSVFNNLAAGTYFVELEDSKNCDIYFEAGLTSIQTLTEPDSLTLWEVKIVDPSCANYTNGSIELTASGGNTRSYSINGGAIFQSSPVFTNLSDGNYSIKVKDNKNCALLKKVATSVVVTAPDSLFIDSVTVLDVTCKDFENGEIVLHASGGNAPISYSIDASKGFYVQNNTFTGLFPGTYSVGIQDVNACPTYSRVPVSIQITEPDSLTLRNIITTQVTCNGDKDGLIQVTATGGNWPLTYAISGTSSVTQTAAAFGSLEGGNYLINVFDTNACPLKVVDGLSRYVSLFEPDPLVIREVSKKDITCFNFNDAELALTVSGGNTPTLYSINNGISYSLNPLFDSLLAGSYVVTATDSNACPVIVNSQSVTTFNYVVTNPPALSAISTVTHNVCKDDELGAVSLAISGGTLATTSTYDIKWFDGSSNIIGTGDMVDSLSADYYTVDIRDDNACLLTVYSTVKEPDSLLVNQIKFADSKCFRSIDGFIEFDIDGGVGPLVSIDSGATMLSQTLFTNLDTGLYTYHVTDVNGCTAFPNNWGQFYIDEPDSFYVSSALVKNVDCFGNATGEIIISAFGGNMLRYSIDSGTTYQDTAKFGNLTAGSYYMQVTDTAGCIGQYSTSNQVIVTEPNLLVGTSTILSGVNCQFDTTGAAEVVIAGGTAPFGILWDTGDTLTSISGLSGLVYEYTITDSNNCVYTDVVIIPTTDADCDSIPDTDDGFDDFDFDGIPNYLDTDSDGDGLSDFLERDYDRDGIVYDDCDDDGFPNFLDIDYCDLFIPTVFTPNGDGVNDYLEIPGIEAYPDNTLSIYNRNGELVFRMAPYDNSFDGESSRTTIIQNPDGFLPTGTYYFTVEIPSIGIRHIGYIYIQR